MGGNLVVLIVELVPCNGRYPQRIGEVRQVLVGRSHILERHQQQGCHLDDRYSLNALQFTPKVADSKQENRTSSHKQSKVAYHTAQRVGSLLKILKRKVVACSSNNT